MSNTTESTSATASPSGLSEWGDIDPPRNRAKANFLKLKPRKEPYIVRLFHKPKLVLRYYNRATNGSAICGNERTCPIIAKGLADSEGKPMKPKRRFAINVIDREDGQVKVMEAAEMVFKEFKKFYENNTIDPGGNDGPDFVIKVTGEGINTKYDTGFKMGSKPFTAEEKALLKANKYDLDELFKATPADKIEDQLFREKDGNGRPSSGSQETASTPASTAAPSKGEDDFNWAQ